MLSTPKASKIRRTEASRAVTMQAAQGRLVGASGASWGPCSVPWGSCAVICPVRPHSQGWKGLEILQGGLGPPQLWKKNLRL